MFPEAWCVDETIDAGDKGCGDLIVELALAFRRMAPQARVGVRATDPGAPIDLPAWCRSTGHRLIEEQHPFYLIERKP